LIPNIETRLIKSLCYRVPLIVILANRLCQKSETFFKVEGISTRTPKKNCHPRECGDLLYKSGVNFLKETQNSTFDTVWKAWIYKGFRFPNEKDIRWVKGQVRKINALLGIVPAKHIITLLCVSAMVLPVISARNVSAEVNMENGDMALSLPLWADLDEDSYELCPEGINVVGMFLAVWEAGQYAAMYKLIDDESKNGYSFDQAKFDLQFLKFKPYTISAVRKSGENFEFFLSYGDWKTGDKDLRKMLISGKTFKIIMPQRGVLFKRSADSSF